MLQHLLQVCILCAVILTVKSYVLFSANLDDFKNLASKFITEELAEKLSGLVSESSISRSQGNGGEQRKSAKNNDKPWKQVKGNNNYDHHSESNDIWKSNLRQRKPTAFESLFKHDGMQENDYDHIEATTYAEIKGKRYKTVKRMPSSKNWYDKPLLFHKTTNINIERPEETHKKNIYHKEDDDDVKLGSMERDINGNIERNKENENTEIERPKKTSKNLVYNKKKVGNVKLSSAEGDVNEIKSNENAKKEKDKGSNGKQMFQPYPVETKPFQLTKEINVEAERGKVNGRNINKKRHKKNREIKGKDDAFIFDTVMMGKKKDSYEDYVTPKRDDDYLIEGFEKTTRRRPNLSPQRERTVKSIFAREETFDGYTEREWKFTKRERTTTEKTKTSKIELEPHFNEPAYGEAKPDSVKARTESLLFDSKELEDNRNHTGQHIMLGTGIPTREHYSMSTPDYYKKLPRIVEKYDFNEPIPEHDRVRETIDDRFAQDPARVNKKVKQQQERADPLDSILENMGFRLMG